jgi:hypothetical protein
MVEDIFEQTLKVTKVPGVKSIGFKNLTFGDAPFRIESITVGDRHGDDVSLKSLILELQCKHVSLSAEFESHCGAEVGCANQ